MKHLILYGQSGVEHQKIQDLLMFTKNWEDCHLVLMQDGVFGAIKGESEFIDFDKQGWTISVLLEDLEARGIKKEKIFEFIKPISYGTLIDLIEAAEKLMSWL
ncbi:MAG: sulfurtransferase complex subunit TusB [Candidatus Lokiarchaeota archaeon]|nr:sulfurtransferase complex subunit TusB [Candidatus Harpocratesius repetitus]